MGGCECECECLCECVGIVEVVGECRKLWAEAMGWPLGRRGGGGLRLRGERLGEEWAEEDGLSRFAGERSVREYAGV
jgi:hypothetical protein